MPWWGWLILWVVLSIPAGSYIGRIIGECTRGPEDEDL